MVSFQIQTVEQHDGDWLYDLIMSGIETDLLTQNLYTLDKKYKNESLLKKQEREQRYVQAFEKFDVMLAGMNDAALREARAAKQKSRKKLQQKEHTERSRETRKAESDIESLLQESNA